MKTNLPVITGLAQPDDLGHVIVTWCKSYHQSDFARSIKFNTYMDHQKHLAQDIVDSCPVLITALEDDPSVIIGYTVFEPFNNDTIIHYIHVKPKFRSFGIATLMIKEIAKGKLFITHKTKHFKLFKELKAEYNPYLFFERDHA